MKPMPPLALLAGGLATRLRPLTKKIPKSMLMVAGEPFIAHQLRLFRRKGVTRIVICAGFLGEMIRNFVDDGARFDLDVDYSFDGDRLLGTGGALMKAQPQLGGSFLAVYGDSWLDSDYRDIVDSFLASRRRALMTVFRNENAWDSSNVEFVDGLIPRYDKRQKTREMDFIDWGLGVLGPDVFHEWTGFEQFDLADVYKSLAERGQLAGYEVRQRFYEIGSAAGLQETDRFLRDHR